MQYNYQAHHGAGDTLLTSKGNKATVSPNPLPEGTVKSGAVYLYGTYPFYCNGSSASTSAGDTNFPSAAAPRYKLPLQKWTDTLIGAKLLLKQQPEPALNSTSLQKRMCQKSSSIIRCPESGKSSERTSTPYLMQETRPYKVFRLHTRS